MLIDLNDPLSQYFVACTTKFSWFSNTLDSAWVQLPFWGLTPDIGFILSNSGGSEMFILTPLLLYISLKVWVFRNFIPCVSYQALFSSTLPFIVLHMIFLHPFFILFRMDFSNSCNVVPSSNVDDRDSIGLCNESSDNVYMSYFQWEVHHTVDLVSLLWQAFSSDDGALDDPLLRPPTFREDSTF